MRLYVCRLADDSQSRDVSARDAREAREAGGIRRAADPHGDAGGLPVAGIAYAAAIGPALNQARWVVSVKDLLDFTLALAANRVQRVPGQRPRIDRERGAGDLDEHATSLGLVADLP